ncbi:MAG: tetratricopeptide repeat protein [Flavobacteriaceae bacterium]|nr:tetratricopeptide repeat protein [Flavobacteriaceae bacterium]
MKTVLNIFCILWIAFGYAQEDLKLTAEGNKEFKEKKLIDAEATYRKAFSANLKNAVPEYNLGNTLYADEHIDAAKSKYASSAESAQSKADKHRAFHNLGNTYMLQKKYQQAVDAYKNSLRNDPTDDETRYNLALAKKMLEKDNKGGGGGGGNDDKKDQDKKDDQKNGDQDKKKGDQDKDKEGENKEDPNEPKNQPEKNQPKEGQQQPKQGALSPQQIKNLLQAAENEEKKAQEKMKVIQGQKPKKTDKDW